MPTFGKKTHKYLINKTKSPVFQGLCKVKVAENDRYFFDKPCSISSGDGKVSCSAFGNACLAVAYSEMPMGELICDNAYLASTLFFTPLA